RSSRARTRLLSKRFHGGGAGFAGASATATVDARLRFEPTPTVASRAMKKGAHGGNMVSPVFHPGDPRGRRRRRRAHAVEREALTHKQESKSYTPDPWSAKG